MVCLWPVARVRCRSSADEIHPWLSDGGNQFTIGCGTPSEVGAQSAAPLSDNDVSSRFNRGSQTFMFPVQLSTDVSSSAIFYATVVPVLAYLVFDRLILQPYTRLEQERYEHSIRTELEQRFDVLENSRRVTTRLGSIRPNGDVKPSMRRKSFGRSSNRFK